MALMQLKQYLSEQGLTYEAFAKAIGVTTKTAWRYAHGERMPKPPIMAKIVAATDGAVREADFYAQGTDGEAA